jgi:hypothetical protein
MLKVLRDRLDLKVRVYEAGETGRGTAIVEPVPWCAVRFGRLCLLLHLGQRVVARVGMVSISSNRKFYATLSMWRRGAI